MIGKLEDLRLALAHEDDRQSIERRIATLARPGAPHVDEAAFERLLAVPLRTIVALLSAIAVGGPGTSPAAGRRP